MPISYPYGFSCWYGYDKDCTALTSFTSSVNTTFSNACTASLTATYYHDGSGSYPVGNDVVYSSSAGGSSNYLSTGYYRLGNGKFMNVGSNGVVFFVADC